MGEVVNLASAKPDLVWVCSCGCQSYRIYGDGSIECANCDLRHSDHAASAGAWVSRLLPEAVPEGDATDAGTLVVANHGSADLAVRRVLKRATEWRSQGHLVVLVSYARDGEGSHWLGIETDEQRAWVIAKLEALTASLKAQG